MISVPKICQQCAAEFACGLSCCWCDEIALDAATRASLKEQFTDCLCRNCLEAVLGPRTKDHGRTKNQALSTKD
jgi:hypothetical protein